MTLLPSSGHLKNRWSSADVSRRSSTVLVPAVLLLYYLHVLRAHLNIIAMLINEFRRYFAFF